MLILKTKKVVQHIHRWNPVCWPEIHNSSEYAQRIQWPFLLLFWFHATFICIVSEPRKINVYRGIYSQQQQKRVFSTLTVWHASNLEGNPGLPGLWAGFGNIGMRIFQLRLSCKKIHNYYNNINERKKMANE